MDRHGKSAWILFAALLVPYALMVRAYWFLCDDAFITWRYSRNWALGHGPVYNLADEVPVEGYSDFLWMALGAAIHAVGLDVTVITPVISALCGVGLLALVWRTLLEAEVPLHVGALALLGLVLSPPFAVWSTSGLETMPQALLTYATWYALARDDDRRAPWVAGICGLLLALIRTEGLAWVVVAVGAAGLQRLLEGRKVLRPAAVALAVACAGYAVYFAWRYSFYRSLFANTAYAKVHLTPETFLRGVEYLGMFAVNLVTPLLLAATLPLSFAHERRGLAAAVSLMIAAILGYAAVVSGDYMAWFRLLVPALPFMAVSFALAAQVLDERARTAWLVPAGLLGVALVGHLPTHDVFVVPRPVRQAFNVREKLEVFRDENAQWAAMVRHTAEWAEKGRALAAYARPGDSLVAGAIGNVGYWSDLHIYDRNGLVTREVAMRPWDGRLRSPGHDKTVETDFFLPDEPTILDAKVIVGGKLKPRVRGALREMRAFRYRKWYYPDLFPMGQRRTLVVLRRADSPDEAREHWARYQAWVTGSDPVLAGAGPVPAEEDGTDVEEPEAEEQESAAEEPAPDGEEP